MHRKFIYIWFSLLLMAACQSSKESEQQASAEDNKLVVYVSNYPLYFFANQIGGSEVEVRFPTSLAPDPAYWQPVADTINAMQSADLVILNGASYEKWLMNVSLPAGKVVVTSSPFTDRLIQSGETFTHSHGPEGEHEHSGTASHTWLDMSLAVLQANAIKVALSKEMPEHATLYETNYARLAEELNRLHQGFIDLNAGESKIHMAFSHPVYDYLQSAYGISGTSLHLEPDHEFDRDMQHDLEHLAADHEISVLIWESEPLKATKERLARMNIQTIVFDPCSNLPAEGDFLAVMQNNLDALSAIYND